MSLLSPACHRLPLAPLLLFALLACFCPGPVSSELFQDYVLTQCASTTSTLTTINRARETAVSGTIPAHIGNCMELAEIKLYSTTVSGTIPPEIGRLTKLEELYLFDLQLSGPLPTEIGKLTKLQGLFLDDTNLVGNVPLQPANLKMLWLNNSRVTGYEDQATSVTDYVAL